MITMRKSIHGLPFLSYMGMELCLVTFRAAGAPLKSHYWWLIKPAFSVTFDMPSFDMLCKKCKHNWLLYGQTQLLVMKDGFTWHQTKASSIKKSFCETSIYCFKCLHLSIIKGGFHGSAHVSKSKYFSSLLISVITLTTPLRCSSVITCYSFLWQTDRWPKFSKDFSGFYLCCWMLN